RDDGRRAGATWGGSGTRKAGGDALRYSGRQGDQVAGGGDFVVDPELDLNGFLQAFQVEAPFADAGGPQRHALLPVQRSVSAGKQPVGNANKCLDEEQALIVPDRGDGRGRLNLIG